MSIARLLANSEPAIVMANSRMLKAVDLSGRRCDPAILSLRSSALVNTVRRWLMATKGRNIHSDLRLASELGDYQQRWDNSAAIALDFETFQRDSRRLLAIVEQRRRSQNLSAGRALAGDSSHGCPERPQPPQQARR